jgi:hypothetical protein
VWTQLKPTGGPPPATKSQAAVFNFVAVTNGNTELLQCNPHNPSLACGSCTAAFDFNVQVEQNFVYSFQVSSYGSIFFGSGCSPHVLEQNVPGFSYRTESASIHRLFATSPNVGLSDTGTRIRLAFGRFQPALAFLFPVTITSRLWSGPFFGMPGQLQLVQPKKHSSEGCVPVTPTAVIGTTPIAKLSQFGNNALATSTTVHTDICPQPERRYWMHRSRH